MATPTRGAFAIGPIVMGQATASGLRLPFFLAAACTTTAAVAALAALNRGRAAAPSRAAA